MRLASRRVLLDDGEIRPASVTVAGERIAAVEPWRPGGDMDVGDRLLAPGLVDIHGDAFERAVMPRPGVMVDLQVGLIDTDRQLLAHGITTAFHGLTWSWEPGLRSVRTALELLAAARRLEPALAADHRWHLRFEAFNLEGLAQAEAVIREQRVGLVAINDHTPGMLAAAAQPTGNLGAAIRSGLPLAAFNALVHAVHGRAAEVDAAVARIARAARDSGIPLLSHDDASDGERARFRALGAAIAEFPKTLAVAHDAVAHGEHVVMGAPNALRGRSHMGKLSAEEAVAASACTILASDYYYPALLQAPFQLAARGLRSLGEAWRLVASNPAAAARLADRGTIVPGLRADLVVIEAGDGLPPRVVATLVAGRLAYELRAAGSPGLAAAAAGATSRRL